MGICGSPDYVAQYGQPQHPDELAGHVCLNFRNRDTGRLYPWVFDVAGERKIYSGSGTVVLDNADVVVRSLAWVLAKYSGIWRKRRSALVP